MPPQLTIGLMGGLGNQLFQIATAYAYAKEHSMDLVLPDSWYDKSDRHPVWDTYFRNSSHGFNLISSNHFRNIHWTDIHEKSFSYAPIYHTPGSSNYRLNGYFQSSTYFNNHKDEIRILLQIPNNLINAANEAFTRTPIHNPDGWIAAHVRRGDYLFASNYHVVTDAEYFKKAREEINKRIGPRTVCWITEDPEWVYKNVHQQGDVVICGDSMTDFACLSQFRHIIMSNSTFSWWATWLNPNNYADRVICCPNKWFGPQGPQDFETIYEPEWIRIETMSG